MNNSSNPYLGGVLIPLVWLSNRYGISPDELQTHLTTLQIETHQLNQSYYVMTWQLELLDSLCDHLQQGESLTDFATLLKRSFLYQCRNCRDLRLTNYVLVRDQLQHCCSNTSRHPLPDLSGELELIARGSYSRLIQWAHSVSLGYDDPWKAP